MEPIFAAIKRTPDVEIAQIKEKFGGLRFYMGKSTEEINELIKAAEHLSYETCEDCGAPGKVRSGGWIRVFCDTCKEEHDRHRPK